MAQPIAMPKLGLTMTAGSVAEWKKHEGEFVRKGDILMVVATDKLTYEVEAPADGTLLKILVQPGVSVPVGEVLAYIGPAGEDVRDGAAGAKRPEKEAPPAPVVMTAASAPHAASAKGTVRTPLLASPLARKTARSLDVDLSLVEGSGPGGRIVRKDVIAFSESRGAAKQRISPTAAKMATELGVDISALQAEGRIMKADILRTQAPASEPGAGDRRIPMTPMRRVIAERMSLSASTIPAVSYDIEADFGNIADLRKALKEPLERRGVKLSINHILMKICARALMEFPMANASKEGNEFVLHGDANIGTAVSVPGGLIVPNVKAVQRKSLGEIATETEALIEKARKGTLDLSEIQGGTFTITNLGMFGIRSFSPIINPPEACILAVSAANERAVVRNGQIVVRPVAILSLAADHRILDGAEAAKFLAAIGNYVENPSLLLL